MVHAVASLHPDTANITQKWVGYIDVEDMGLTLACAYLISVTGTWTR